jgi:hypothetical protein
MRPRQASAPEFEIGRYICPTAKREAALKASEPLAFVHWPLVVKNCSVCGRKHKLELRDVQHPPVYGYE